MPDTPASLLEFPCRFPVKAFGREHPEFADIVFELVRQHAEDLSRTDVRQNNSSGGRFLAITVTVNATSQRQLDDIYKALTAHELVVMAL